MNPVSSFDVFDTCLTRTFAYPVDLFFELGEISARNGWIVQMPREFMAKRIAAENAARRLSASREIVLADIYRLLVSELKLDTGVAAKIQKMELELEELSLQPILEMRHRIAQARQQGRQILFLSDMYLPSAFLERLLRKHEFLQDGDILHVSGEVGRGKHNGGLFEHARDLLKNNFTEWTHLGDNPRSDVESPRQLGLSAEHFEHGLLNRYELQICPKLRLRHTVTSRLLTHTRLDRLAKLSSGGALNPVREKWKSRLAAAMRIARLSKLGGMSPGQKVFWDTGANLMGPLFYKQMNSLRPELANESSFASKTIDALSVTDREILEGGILAFSNSYADLDDGSCSQADYIKAILSLWQLFRKVPTATEIETFGFGQNK